MTLIELLISMAVFMVIMALTLAVWQRASHVVQRAHAIMNLHYQAHRTMTAFEFGMRTSTPCAFMYLTHAPQAIRIGDGNADNVYYNNINVFHSTMYGKGERQDLEGGGSSSTRIEDPPTKSYEYDVKIINENGNEQNTSARWGYRHPTSVYGAEDYSTVGVWEDGDENAGTSDQNFIPYNSFGMRIPINEDGSLVSYTEGCPHTDPALDPRGFPFNTYPTSTTDPIYMEGDQKARPYNTSTSDARVMSTGSFAMRWCNTWHWYNSENNPGRFEPRVKSGNSATNLTKMADKSIPNRFHEINAEVFRGWTVKPYIDEQIDTLDNMAYVYRAINGRAHPLFAIGEPALTGADSNAINWSKTYGELVVDGDVQYVVTAPMLEFALTHTTAQYFTATYETPDKFGNNSIVRQYFRQRMQRRDSDSPDGLEWDDDGNPVWHPSQMEPWPQHGMTGDYADGRKFYQSHPFYLQRERGIDSFYGHETQDPHLYYQTIPAVVGVMITTESHDAQNEPFPEDGFFNRMTSPNGGVPLRQPRWVRLTFQLVEDSDIPIRGGQNRVIQSFDHWVRVR